MGANPTGEQQTQKNLQIQKYWEKLDYIMETNMPTFGYFKIYKMQQKPYQYLMAKTYTSLIDDQILQKKKAKYSNLPTNKNIVPFDYINLRQVQEKCSKHKQLITLSRYYYFTLEQAIKKKIKKQLKFPQQQILYITKTLLSVYQSMHKISDEECEIFRADSIFLSPQGFIKIYPQINEWKQQIGQQVEEISRSVFSFANQNQVQLDLGRKKKDICIKQKHKNDILDIGIILLSVICVAKESDFIYENEDIKFGIVKFVLNKNSFNDYENRSLTIFRSLLKGIFQEKWTIVEIKNQLLRLQQVYQIKNGTRIKIINNENQQSDLTVNDDSYSKLKQSRLKMMSKYQLVPGKIQCLSSTKGSNNKI